MSKMFTSGSKVLWPRESTWACQKPLVLRGNMHDGGELSLMTIVAAETLHRKTSSRTESG